MKIAIIGLGLIGGSLARTIRANTDHFIYGADLDSTVVDDALAAGVLNAELMPWDLIECDLIAVALFPAAAVSWMQDNAPLISSSAIVFDCAGIKTSVCEAGFALAGQHRWQFFGGHPMAGTERSGWGASRAGLFDGASMLLVPPEKKDDRTAAAQQLLEAFFLSLGFGRVVYTTAAAHDATIAYTSQLAHVVSSAYIKSPTAQNYVGFSAGSFQDMTRVAFLNENMWTELFLENKIPLVDEIEFLIGMLKEYRDAIAGGDAAALKELLAEGKILKTRSLQKMNGQQ